MCPHFTRKSITLGSVLVVVGVATALSATKKPAFTKHDKAYYASQSLVSFVRPGLTLKVLSATIASDGTIKAQFSVTDPAGVPLDMYGVTTPGAVSVQLVAATIPKGQKQYVASLVSGKVLC